MNRKNLYALLKDLTKKEDAVQMLRDRKLHHTAASWDDLLEKRIAPEIGKGNLREEDLLDLIRDAEEHGKQHVFLFKRKSGGGLPTDAALRSWLARTGNVSILDEPRLLQHPANPTLVEVRRHPRDHQTSVVAKEIERRYSGTQIDESLDGQILTRQIRLTPVRVVNVIKLHSDGLLEFRAGIGGNKADYLTVRTRLWNRLDGLLSATDFVMVSLHRARKHLFENRASLSSKLRYSGSMLHGRGDRFLTAAMGDSQEDFFKDPAADDAMDRFARGGDAACEELGFTFLGRDGAQPEADVRITIAGEHNEFIVTNRCSGADYDHALSELRRFNR